MTKRDILTILDEAEKMEKKLQENRPLKIAEGKLLAALFFEPSTRTRFSFEAAMGRLGGKTLGFSDVTSTSVKKGESFSDTIRTIDQYVDIIVIRHPLEGSARLAAKVAQHPVINAGDGANQHPTQTLLDLFSIKKMKGKLENVHVSLVGDLKHGRTMRSLFYALAMFKAKITLVAPKSLLFSQDLINEVKQEFDIEITITENFSPKEIEEPDVLYLCRIQEERFEDPIEAKRLARSYRLTPELLAEFPTHTVVLHPLPRRDEIDVRIDTMKQARYFDQAKLGVPTRMAIISLLLENFERMKDEKMPLTQFIEKNR